MIIFKKLFVVFLILLLSGCSQHAFITRWTRETCPPAYNVRFTTTKGNFDVHVERRFSPYAVDRFYQLVKHKSLNDVLFYRVVPNFVAQFGLSDSTLYKSWDNSKLPDEEVKYGNKKGTLSFARSGPKTRSSDLFINLRDNSRLDTTFYDSVRGFPAFGSVTKGMAVVESLYSGYGNSTMDKYDTLFVSRKKFLQLFPHLDKIQKVYILK